VEATNAIGQATARNDDRLVGSLDEPVDERLYRRMRFIRYFEERLLELFDQGAVAGTTHASVGQEADSVGVMEHLLPDDDVFSNHRCHGHYLAHTGDARGLMAEIMGKPEGVCGGIGGSQHLASAHFKSNGVQGGIVPAAAGIALAHQLARRDSISVAFIGDGTLGEGVVYETMNLASLWDLPLLVVVEDNGWAQSTPKSANLAGDVEARFTAFGLSVEQIDSTDVRQIGLVARRAVDRVRTERKPCVLIIHTYRLCHHSKNDDNRPAAEVQERWLSDPLRVHGRRLDAETRNRLDDEVGGAIDELIAELSAA
jgi:acetoin:2,6-dichlorophenolindophenol oxidoreductase subunit alpha